ncbi:MAG TPA: phosphatase PAP2 family protein [Marmoricola sp.]|nr:phosphatase PAP2 family protein [Marmoricola sp.]HEU5045392.1 phosphatase PAP2 family protein [Nocardioidaceae bacterium]
MDQLIVIVAQYAIYAVAVGAVIAWLLVRRPEKYTLAAQAIVTMILVAILVKVAGAVHTDPRPFVQDSSLKPLFPHPADNGFPSDHTALTFGIATIVFVYRRAIGVVLMVISLGIGAARVAANVHHVQDIIAAVAIGVVAALLSMLLTRPLTRLKWWPRS